MTGTSHPDLDELLSLWANPRMRENALLAMQQPAVMALVKQEIGRLEDRSGPRALLDHDEVSRRVHQALTSLVAAHYRAFPPPAREA